MLTDEEIEVKANRKYGDHKKPYDAAYSERCTYMFGMQDARDQMMPEWHVPTDHADRDKYGNRRRTVLCMDPEDGELYFQQAKKQAHELWRECIPRVDFPIDWPIESSKDDDSSQSEREGDGE